MTCLGEPKAETAEALEVDNLPEAETLLEEMIRVIPVLLSLTVMDPMPHPPDPRDFLGSRRRHWSREKKDKYDRRYAALNKFIQECYKAKKSSYRPKKPEKLGVDPFTGDPKDTQRFVHDVEIKLDYFCDSLVKEIDKVSLVIPLLRDTAKE